MSMHDFDSYLDAQFYEGYAEWLKTEFPLEYGFAFQEFCKTYC